MWPLLYVAAAIFNHDHGRQKVLVYGWIRNSPKNLLNQIIVIVKFKAPNTENIIKWVI